MTSIIYRIDHNSDEYQYFVPKKGENDWEILETGCQPKRDIWEPPQMVILEPFLKQGAFYNYNSDYLITSPRCTELLEYFFETTCEILPLPYEGETYSFINVLKCFDCLDKEKTKWRPSGLPDEYVFNPNLLPHQCLFKIPQTAGGEMFLLADPDDNGAMNLMVQLEKYDLQGLEFTEIWRTEE